MLLGYQAALNTKATVIENILSDTTRFITTPKINKITKRSIRKKKEVVKNIASKSQIDNAVH